MAFCSFMEKAASSSKSTLNIVGESRVLDVGGVWRLLFQPLLFTDEETETQRG